MLDWAMVNVEWAGDSAWILRAKATAGFSVSDVLRWMRYGEVCCRSVWRETSTRRAPLGASCLPPTCCPEPPLADWSARPDDALRASPALFAAIPCATATTVRVATLRSPPTPQATPRGTGRSRG